MNKFRSNHSQKNIYIWLILLIVHLLFLNIIKLFYLKLQNPQFLKTHTHKKIQLSWNGFNTNAESTKNMQKKIELY